MTIENTVIRRPDLPPLAWCVELHGKERCATLIHGAGVEVRERAFVEGAWDGDFAAMRPEQASFLAGSGGRLDEQGCELFTASHTLEAIYSVTLPDRWIASNSLVFVLQAADLKLDPAYSVYLLDLRTVTRGLRAYNRTLPTLQGPPVHRHYVSDLRVDVDTNGDIGCQARQKSTPNGFRHYNDYLSFLRETLAALFANAAHESRCHAYRPLATLSSGYDSTACATLAAGLGCREAVTIRDASWGATRVDSGAEIGRRLGLDVTEAGVRDYLQHTGTPEAEFVALGDTGDVQLSAFESMLPGRLLITGFHGDKVWDPNNTKVGPDMIRGDASGCSLAEFRYRVGFIHVPVPFIACMRHEDIHRISNEHEMQPWRIGGDYDRPIPRRIAEEGGVPRELFGQKKAATAIWWTRAEQTDASQASYAAFRATNRQAGLGLGRWIHAVAYTISRLWTRLASLFYRVTNKLGRGIRLPQIVPYRWTEPPGESQLVQWGVATIRDRYSTEPIEAGRRQTIIRRRIVDWEVRRDESHDPSDPT